jgi:hypothetical protein
MQFMRLHSSCYKHPVLLNLLLALSGSFLIKVYFITDRLGQITPTGLTLGGWGRKLKVVLLAINRCSSPRTELIISWPMKNVRQRHKQRRKHWKKQRKEEINKEWRKKSTKYTRKDEKFASTSQSRNGERRKQTNSRYVNKQISK